MYSQKPSTPLKKSTPEQQGVSSRGLLEFYKSCVASGYEFHHLSIAIHGYKIAQGSWVPYRAEFPHMSHSLTKMFTNTAVAMACDEGLISLDDKVISFFPDELPEVVSDKLAAMTLRDVIQMRSGHAHMISGSKWRQIKTSWVVEYFKEPVEYWPGEYYNYTSAGSYMLSAIVQKVTGKSIDEYLKEKLFVHLGIEGLTWDKCPNGICSGGNGITVRNEDVLKMGVLYINNGVYEGKRYISPEWCHDAMYESCKLNESGYGYHFTNYDGAISAGGLFGQTLVMIPEYDVVIALNAAYQENNQDALDHRVLDLLKEHLYPAISDSPLPEDPEGYKALEDYTAGLKISVPVGSVHSPKEDAFSGTYVFEDPTDNISSMTFEFHAEGCSVAITDHRGTHQIECGAGKWVYEYSSMTGNYLHHQYQPDSTLCGGYGYWEDPETYVMKWAWVYMTFIDTCVCKFADGSMSFKRSVNVNTQDKERPLIYGKK
ncbi:MAG: serine hydrolase [Clostridiaceae bacterium]|jgi:hypothetical protein|nr:serine hydrolase [Clostridiaceae bacterium]